MKKISVYHDFLLTTLDQLYEIKLHTANGRPFEAGFDLGRLVSNLAHQLEQVSDEQYVQNDGQVKYDKYNDEKIQ